MLTGYYSTPLVLVSILVAFFASYTTFSLAGRIASSQPGARRFWIGGGALAMGTGIWSMHFIGMLAFRLPIPIGFDLALTLLSLLLPIVVSALALWQIGQPELPWRRLLSGAVLMGAGISAMHYTGMAAMRMEPGIRYDGALFAASILIAIAGSGAALRIAFRLRLDMPHVWLPRAGAAVLMGAAIAGMHYTGMAAVSFPADSICLAAPDGFGQNELAVLVIIATAAVLSITLLTSIYDARLGSRSQILAMSQATAEERQVLLTREREARTQAERMSEMKDEFVATLSHELRTPLNSILGWAQLLRFKLDDEAALRKGLETIERNARAQEQLIEDLLDMSRIVSGKVRLDVQLVDPAVFIDAALETVRPAAIAKNIRLETAFDPDAGPILGDPNRLQQVIWNLLSNAVKFTPNGGYVRLALRKSAREIVVDIIDSGIGIDADFLPHVFDRFRQANASTTRRYGGLGIGLSIAKQLVELHGGTMRVASKGEGKGTKVSVRLPLHDMQAAAVDQPSIAPKAEQAAAENFRPADLSGIKVLIVDDEADARDLISQILADCGAETLTATNAGDALLLAEHERPDAIICDIGMPDVDGFELIRRIRALGEARGSNVPAIALTAFTRSQDKKQALQAGFTRYLSKPVKPSELVSTIESLAVPRAALQ